MSKKPYIAEMVRSPIDQLAHNAVKRFHMKKLYAVMSDVEREKLDARVAEYEKGK